MCVVVSLFASGRVTQVAYDADGHPIRSAAQIGTQWLVSCQSYSLSGKVIKTWGPAQTASADTCPAAAAPTPVADLAYDDLDRPIRVTENLLAGEGGNRITETAYNADDSIQRVTRGVGTALAQATVTTTYTANGLPATVKDAKGNLTTWEYDGHDRRLKTRYPDKTTAGVSSTTDYEQVGYDANGNPTSLRTRDGQSVTLAWDNLNRLTGRSYPNAADNLAFAYDLLGRRTAVSYTNGSHAIAYAWDNAGRLAATTAGGKTLTHQYDAAGNRTRSTWPEAGFTVTTAYDAKNRPTVIKENGSVSLATYAWDDLSRRSSVTLGNGTSFGYHAQGDLASLTHNLTGTAQDLTVSLTRNQAREILTKTESNDLYQWTGAANGSKAYTANGLNQTTTVAGTSLSYDAKGNLTGDGVWTYAYDPDNRLKSASKSGTTAALAYDGEGRLRQTVINGTATNLLYDGSDLVAEYDSANAVLRRYVHGPGIDEPLVWYEGSGKTC